MLKNGRNEQEESGKSFVVTIALTKFLLLSIIAGIFWLVQIILSDSIRLNEITRGFNLQ